MKVKAKRVVGVFLIFLFLFGFAQFFVPVTEGQQSSLLVDRSYWLRLANNAWKYYQPGVGVDSTTGLHGAALGYPYFTDWDLGVYIQTIIDVNKLGILSTSGTWGADARINKILAFLQTRQLSSNGLPYERYQSANGNPYVNNEQYAADAGELLVALHNLKVFRPDIAGTINYIVYNRTNYAPLEQAVDILANSKNIYDYYVANGFASFWPSRFSTLASSILNNIVSAPTVSTYGVTLPISKLTFEPLLLSVFNLAPNTKLNGLIDQVYSAHEARYKSTNKFVAFSEGNTGLDNPEFVYEWVVKEDGSTWTIDNVLQDKVEIVPIIYFKVAVGLLAIYNTPFTKNMASYIESHLPIPSSGYSDGIDENGRVDTVTVDKNGMIIEAAIYAINNPPKPTSTPSPNPTPSVSPSVSPTQSTTPTIDPTPTPSEYPSPTQNLGASSSPSSSSTPSGSLPTSSPSKLPTSNTSSTPITSQSPTPPENKDRNQPTTVPLHYALIAITFMVFATSIIVLIRKQRKRSQSVSLFLSKLFRFSLYVIVKKVGKDRLDAKV